MNPNDVVFSRSPWLCFPNRSALEKPPNVLIEQLGDKVIIRPVGLQTFFKETKTIRMYEMSGYNQDPLSRTVSKVKVRDPAPAAGGYLASFFYFLVDFRQCRLSVCCSGTTVDHWVNKSNTTEVIYCNRRRESQSFNSSCQCLPQKFDSELKVSPSFPFL